MSKLNGKLCYKDWYILKHALRNQIDQKEQFLIDNPEGALNKDTIAILEAVGMDISNIKVEDLNIMEKEIAEERKTLERVTDIIDKFNIKPTIKRVEC